MKLLKKSQKHVAALIAVALVFGSVGAYMLLQGNAATGDTYELFFPDPENTTTHPAGKTFSKKLYIKNTPKPSQAQNPTGKLRLDLTIHTDREYVKYLPPFTCAPLHKCTPGDGYSSDIVGFRQDFHTCIDISQQRIGQKNVYLLTIKYRSIQDHPYRMRATAVWASGTCAKPSGSFQLIHNEGWLFGRCMETSGSDAECTGGHSIAGLDDGTSPGPGPGDGKGTGTGTGSGGAGTGTDGRGTGTSRGQGSGSGGGGGSTARTQSPEPNPIPSSTSQGNKTKQPEIEPSPFFDGKEFEKGSDPISQIAGTATIAGNTIPRFWLYLAGGLAVAGAGAGYWWWKKR